MVLKYATHSDWRQRPEVIAIYFYWKKIGTGSHRMLRSRPIVTTRIFCAVCIGIIFSPARSSSQQTPSAQVNAFANFFSRLATATGVGGSRGEAAYIELINSIAAMQPADLLAGIPIIDQQIDNKAEPQDRLAKSYAANLLMLMSLRPDGAQLLADQMDRLVSMLNDPSHFLSGPAVAALDAIGLSRPTVVWPILEAALEAPDVNNKTGIGPDIAVVLLRMGPHGDDVTKHVAQYMRRPDLTDAQLTATIIWIDSTPVIPDLLTAELVRCLDRPAESVKLRALVGISRSTPSAKDGARQRMQKMANDPRETARVRRIAAQALQGGVTEDPENPN